MTLPKSRFAPSFRRARERAGGEPAGPTAPRGGDGAPVVPHDDERAGAEGAEACWRGSSYDLKHGLDVVELPTSLPVDVLDRLFNAPRR